MANVEKFNQMASCYDNTERTKISHMIAEEIKTELKHHSYRKALDYGCGTGVTGLDLVGEFEELILMDASEAMITIVQEKLVKQEVKNASAVCFDLEQTDALPDTYDFIYIVQTLLHIPDEATLLGKLVNALNPGGKLLIVDYNKITLEHPDVHTGFVIDELRQVLETAALTDIQYRTFYEGEKMLVGQDASLFILSGVKKE